MSKELDLKSLDKLLDWYDLPDFDFYKSEEEV